MARVPAVLIVDQDQDSRFEMKRLVKECHLDIGGEAAFGTEAVAMAVERKPDVILVAVNQPIERPLQTLSSLAAALPETPIIVYSRSRDLETAQKSMLAGARNFLPVPARADEVRRTIVETLAAEERLKLPKSASGIVGPEATTITVFSAKGGVGKSTLAVNLAVALARRGHETVLVDADVSFGDAGDLLDLKPEYTIAELAAPNTDLGPDGVLSRLTKHETGLRVVAAPHQPLAWRDITGDRFRRVIEELQRRFDMVIIDCSSQLSDVTLAALQEASFVLWVTTPEYTAVKDSIQAFNALRQLGFPLERVRVALNHVSPDSDVRPQAIAEAMGQALFWSVPYDRMLRRSTMVGKPIVLEKPDAAAAESIAKLAAVVSGVGTGPARKRSLLSRVLTFGRNGAMPVEKPSLATEEVR